MLNNERNYPEPHEFKPERFLKDGKLDDSVRDPMDIAFGFGRRWGLFILSISPFSWCHHRSGRICPGKHLAHSILTLAAAYVLSAFDLVRKLDENGREVEPKKEFTITAIRQVTFSALTFFFFFFCFLNVIYSQPLNFPCVIKPRSRYTEELIRSSSGLDLVE